MLIATSVGEEGLDIPTADLVIFYEPVASEIRTIQRRGRTGRQRDGDVVVLIAEDTRDEERERLLYDVSKTCIEPLLELDVNLLAVPMSIYLI